MSERYCHYYSDSKVALDRNVKRIDENDSKRIILVGEGTGRSTLTRALSNDEDLRFNYIRTGSIGTEHMYQDSYNGSERRAEDTHIELLMTNAILEFVRSNGIYDWNDYSLNELMRYYQVYSHEFIEWKSGRRDKYLIPYVDMDLFEYSKPLMDLYRKHKDIKPATLIVDDFDIANGSNKYTQERFSEYFDMFDRIILVCNDPSLRESIGSISTDYLYSEVLDIVRSILGRRYSTSNPKEFELFYEFVTFDNVRLLHKRFNGNIDMIVKFLGDVIENNVDFSYCCLKQDGDQRKRVPKLYV